MATRPRSSASATRSRCGRPVRRDRSMRGRPAAAGSSISTASSAARTTSGTRRSMRARRRSSRRRRPAEGYHLTEDLTDKAIAWTRQQKALLPDKPFFMYFAPGATHAPHHVPKEWIEKYKGKFAHGWDKQREITFKRQKELGVIARRRRADAAARGDSGLGRDGSQAQAGARARDGSVRRVHGAHRPPRRPADRRAQGPGRCSTTR